MHPRNRYQGSLDFPSLMAYDPSLRPYVLEKKRFHQSPIYSYAFEDPTGIRLLTQALLRKDFQLNIILPPDKLVPTLPNRYGSGGSSALLS